MFARRIPLIALTASLFLSGCGRGKRLPEDAARILEKANTIELVSLDPDHEAKTPAGGLRGWRVLGRATLAGDDKRAILAALQSGIEDSEGRAAKCFNPRHGIEATYEGKTVELVICFECLSMEGWNDGKPFKALTTSGPSEEFNRMLKAKGVKLPKGKE